MVQTRRGIRIAHRLRPRPTPEDLAYFQQMDIDAATIWTTIEDNNEAFMSESKALLEDHGILINNIGILDLHCDPAMTLGLAEQDEKIEQYKRYLRALGKAGITYTTYAHMANIKMLPYYQTGMGPTRGGVMTREFDVDKAKSLPLSHGREYSEDEIWASLTRFLREVIPVAEEAGVRIGLHPDDPPVPNLGGVARVIRNIEGYERALEIADSPNFGICHCVGTWAEGGATMVKDPVEFIRYFGAGKIWKIHFRNVDAPLPVFKETFVDNGYVDMYVVLRTLREAGFDGALLPDHVPGDSNHTSYTLGYMRALRDRVNAEFAGA